MAVPEFACWIVARIGGRGQARIYAGTTTRDTGSRQVVDFDASPRLSISTRLRVGARLYSASIELPTIGHMQAAIPTIFRHILAV